MKTKLCGLSALLLFFVVQISFAQSKTVTGTVSDGSGMPLPGVNIVIQKVLLKVQTLISTVSTLSQLILVMS